MRRTVNDFINGVSAKCSVDPTRVTSVVRVNARGIRIAIDDEVVRELPEGQDMLVEFHDAEHDPMIKNELLTSTSDLLIDGDIMASAMTSHGIEMRLIF